MTESYLIQRCLAARKLLSQAAELLVSWLAWPWAFPTLSGKDKLCDKLQETCKGCKERYLTIPGVDVSLSCPLVLQSPEKVRDNMTQPFLKGNFCFAETCQAKTPSSLLHTSFPRPFSTRTDHLLLVGVGASGNGDGITGLFSHSLCSMS